MNVLTHYVVPFAAALGVLILVHELGHYLVARWCGVKVLRFSIGFGRPLLKYQSKSGTEWVLAMIPLGGYVKMLGENDDEVNDQEVHLAFSRKPLSKRFAIVAAGPVFNLLLAVVLYWGLFVGGSQELRPLIAPSEAPTSLARDAGVREGDLVLSVDGDPVKSWQDLRWALLNRAIDRSQARLLVREASGGDGVRVINLRNFSIDDVGKDDPVMLMGLIPASVPALIDRVEADGAAARAGMLKGDEIIAIDDRATASIREVREIVQASPGQTRTFVVRRNERELSLPVNVEAKKHENETSGFIGVMFDTSHLFAEVRYGPFDALARAVRQTQETSLLTLKSIWQMILGNISLKNVSGPITIADFAGKSAQMGMATFIKFLAFISISLGVLNLLPIPVLDGGHLLYYAAEFVRGSALPERVVELGQRVGLALLLVLMAFALFNDINRLFS